MKRTWMISLALLALLLAACGGGSPANNKGIWNSSFWDQAQWH